MNQTGESGTTFMTLREQNQKKLFLNEVKCWAKNNSEKKKESKR